MGRTTSVWFVKVLLNLVNPRDLFGVGTKLKKIIFKNNNQISFTFTTRTWVLSIEWTRMWPSIGIQMKKWSWLTFVWIVDVVIQSACLLYRINKDKGVDSLPLLAFWRHVVNIVFLKYSEEGRLSLSHLGIRNISLDVCYDDTKHYQVQSEHRH